MTTQSRSIVVQSSNAGEITTHILPTTEEHIADGDVLIHVAYSSLNFKDGMALRGDRGVARTFPLVPASMPLGQYWNLIPNGSNQAIKSLPMAQESGNSDTVDTPIGNVFMPYPQCISPLIFLCTKPRPLEQRDTQQLSL